MVSSKVKKTEIILGMTEDGISSLPSDKVTDNVDELLTKLAGKSSSYYRGFNNTSIVNTEFVRTDFPSINYIMGGGYPRAKIVEIAGEYSAGKSTIMYALIGSLQRQGYSNILFDVEASYTDDWAAKCGIDIKKLAIFKPDTLEEALEGIKLCIASNVDFIWIDSVPAMMPKSIVEGSFSDTPPMGIRARKLSEALPQFVSAIGKGNNKTTITFLNQFRATMNAYGASQDTTGGAALKYYSSVRMKISKGKAIGNGGSADERVGQLTKIETIKNKLYPPFRVGEVSIFYGSDLTDYEGVGIDVNSELSTWAIKAGIVKVNSSWYLYKDGKYQGALKFLKAINTDPKLKAGLVEEVNTYIESVMHKEKEV